MSQIKISVPDTLLYQMKKSARREGVSLEQYIIFALTRQTMLIPVIGKVSEGDAELQQNDFFERIKRLGKASSEELEEILKERDRVEPESGLDPQTVLQLKNRISKTEDAS